MVEALNPAIEPRKPLCLALRPGFAPRGEAGHWLARTPPCSADEVSEVTLYYKGEVLVHKILMGEYGNNGYLLVCPQTNESLVIDAPGEPEKLVAVARGTTPRAILITHTHMDHLVGLGTIRSALGAPVGVHAAEADNLPSPPDFNLSDGKTVTAGTMTLKIIHTPGHTPGAVCFLIGNHLFSGDTLFPGGPGHTRTPQNLMQIISSIKDKLLVLPEDTVVYPGHGENTTVGKAREEYAVFASRVHPPELCGDVLWLTS